MPALSYVADRGGQPRNGMYGNLSTKCEEQNTCHSDALYQFVEYRGSVNHTHRQFGVSRQCRVEKNVALDRSKRRRLVTQGGWVCMSCHMKVRRFEIERLKSHSTKRKEHINRERFVAQGNACAHPFCIIGRRSGSTWHGGGGCE